MSDDDTIRVSRAALDFLFAELGEFEKLVSNIKLELHTLRLPVAPHFTDQQLAALRYYSQHEGNIPGTHAHVLGLMLAEAEAFARRKQPV